MKEHTIISLANPDAPRGEFQLAKTSCLNFRSHPSFSCQRHKSHTTPFRERDRETERDSLTQLFPERERERAVSLTLCIYACTYRSVDFDRGMCLNVYWCSNYLSSSRITPQLSGKCCLSLCAWIYVCSDYITGN